MRNYFKKITAITLIALLFSPSLSPVQAEGLDNPKETAQNMMQGIMELFGADTAETKNAVQTMNVYRQKKTPPQVSLVFTPSSPTPGEKVTATAAPSYFLNDATQMYYTWFIKHPYCKTAKKSDSKYNAKCDLNDDDEVDIEDYKIEAMRIIVNGEFEWEKESYSSDNDSDNYKAVMGGQDQRGKSNHCYVHDVNLGNEYELPECKHLFPNAPGETTGDDSFGIKEEKFWHTNPNSNDTANTGSVDEATIAGLGKNVFSWDYQSGDQVGVAVEGISVEATQFADSSYKIMWALPKNICDIDDHLDSVDKSGTVTTTETAINPSNNKIRTTTTVVTTVTDNSITAISTIVTATTIVTDTYFPDENGNYPGYPSSPDSTTSSTSSSTKTKSRMTMKINDLNECLESNLVEPAEGSSNKKLDVTLSYMPDSPINDISDSGSNSDELVLQTSILNSENKDFVNYAWQISLGDSIGTENWRELTKSDLTAQTELKQTSGMGLRSIRLKMNFKKSFLSDLGLASSNTFYIKAKLNATENVSAGFKKEGVATVIIPVHLSSSKIQVFSTQVSDQLDISLDPASERCSSGLSNVVCPVAKDEIVGLKADLDPDKYSLLWTLNGEVLPYQGTCNSDICDKDNNYSNSNFFPILKGKSTRYTVGLTADDKETGEKITLTKIFEVSDPTISIASADENTSKPILLGNYVDLDNKLWPDYSTTSFEALQGTTVKLKPLFNMPSNNGYTWFLDDAPVTSENAVELGVALEANGILSFPADKRIGENYSVSVGALYTQPNLVKKALNKYWGVPLNNFYEKQIGNSIDISITDYLSGSAVSARNSNKKILASLFSEIPAYVNFLFRIVLTTLLILFTTGILFSLFPKQSEN